MTGPLMRINNLTVFFFFSALLLALSSAYLLSVVSAQQNFTRITCEVSIHTITYGDYVSISGKLVDVSTGQGLKRLINLTYSEDNGTAWKQLKLSGDDNLEDWGYNEINTTDDGYFGPYKWYPEHVPHDILIKAFWTGDLQYEPSESAIQTLQVNLPLNLPISIPSHRSYVQVDTLWVAGEIRNEGVTNLKYVKISLVYNDILGKIVGVDDVYADIHILAPGEKSPFGTFAGISYGSPFNASLISNYRAVVRAYQNTTEEPYRNFQILNETSWFDEYGYYHLSGEVKNTGAISITFLEVYATFYSANETVVDVWFDTLMNFTDALNPDDTRPFDIQLSPYRLEAAGPIDHYVLQIDSEPVMTSSSIFCDVSPSEISLGEPVTVLGFINPSHEMANVTLYYTWQNSTLELRTVFTDAIGLYNDTFTPSIAGAWNVYASWPGDFDSYGALSTRAYFNVSKIPASISCFVSSEKIQLGENIKITGSISPALEKANATLVFIKPDNSTLIQNIAIENGEYACTYKPESSGSWHVRANWLGNTNHEGANSTLAAFAVEFLIPVRQIVPPENTAVAMVVGTGVTVGIATSMSLGGFAQSFNEAISRLSVPKWLKDFLNLYGEKTFETLTKEEMKAMRKKKMITVREVLSLVFAGATLLIVFVYVEVNGMPNLLNTEYLLAAVPQVLISVVLVFALSQIFSIISAKTLSICCEFKIWLYGLVALFITGIVFMIPFASPGKMEYEGDIDPKKAGLTATSKILCILILCIPFYLFYALGFTTIADAGLMMTTMTACYSAFPFKPLEGNEIFKYRKSFWIVIFISSLSMFVCTIFNLLPRVTYLLTGTVATLLFSGLILTLRRQQKYR